MRFTACGMDLPAARYCMSIRRRPWAEALVLSIGAGVLVAGLGTVPGMGIPGALVLIPATPFLAMLAEGDNLFPRDTAWPFALALTWMLGALLPLAWMLTRRWQGMGRAVAFPALWTAMATLGAVAFYRWGIVGI